MKRLLLLLLLIATFIPALQAQADSARQSHAKKIFMPDYYQKSKRQIQAGFVLAGTGIGLGAVGYALIPKTYFNLDGSSNNETEAITGSLLFIGGAALVISSIPCFILGGLNKHKAKLILQKEDVSFSPPLRRASWQYKAGITISL